MSGLYCKIMEDVHGLIVILREMIILRLSYIKKDIDILKSDKKYNKHKIVTWRKHVRKERSRYKTLKNKYM